VAEQWKLSDPDGFARAVKDGTFTTKLAEWIKEISIIIDETPVTLRKAREGETFLGQFSRKSDFQAKPPIKTQEITLIPEAMDAELLRHQRETQANNPFLPQRGRGATNEVARHEFIHDRDAALYDKLVPSSPNKPYGSPVPKTLQPTNVNPVTGASWNKGWMGNAAEGMPAINALSTILEDAVQKAGVDKFTQAEYGRRRQAAEGSADWNANAANLSRLKKFWSEWFPEEYGSRSAWESTIRRSESNFTSAVEVLPRVNNLQKALLQNKMDFFDIINMEKDSKTIFNKKAMDSMPLDVQQLADYMQKSVDQGVVSKPIAISYLARALQEARIYFPKQYSLGIIGR